MAKAPAFLDRVREFIAYDPETGLFTWIKARQKVVVGAVAGSVNKITGYLELRFEGQLVYGHHLAWWFSTGEWPADRLDHKNTKRADNRIKNLREATQQQNIQNSSIRKGRRFKGARRRPLATKNPWLSVIKANGRLLHLGCFATEEEAARAYDAAAVKHFGEFARPNFPAGEQP